MNLYIDESGSFVCTPNANSWSIVGCYATSDDDYNRAKQILKNLKESLGFKNDEEVKLGDLEEADYFRFLTELNRLGATFHAVATDLSINTLEEIQTHQTAMANNMVENIDKMKHDQAKQHLKLFKKNIENFATQLYVQLFLQFHLIDRVIGTTIPFYVQRNPTMLSRFRWRIDQKNITKTTFEEMFEILSPMILQTRSLKDPLIMIEGGDYRALQKYFLVGDDVPAYLKDAYGINIQGGVNIHKIIRDDIQFVDSRKEPGVQIADLLSSGLRKCLRIEFDNNALIASALGKIMVQAKDNEVPIGLLKLSAREYSFNSDAIDLIQIMYKNQRSFLKQNRVIGFT